MPQQQAEECRKRRKPYYEESHSYDVAEEVAGILCLYPCAGKRMYSRTQKRNK